MGRTTTTSTRSEGSGGPRASSIPSRRRSRRSTPASSASRRLSVRLTSAWSASFARASSRPSGSRSTRKYVRRPRRTRRTVAPLKSNAGRRAVYHPRCGNLMIIHHDATRGGLSQLLSAAQNSRGSAHRCVCRVCVWGGGGVPSAAPSPSFERPTQPSPPQQLRAPWMRPNQGCPSCVPPPHRQVWLRRSGSPGGCSRSRRSPTPSTMSSSSALAR